MSAHFLPLLQHAIESASAFAPERLMDAVRTERGLALEAVPPLCVLDFDGDLSDRMAEEGITSAMASWACFHTSMRTLTLDGLSCGIVPRTIGGPYALLVAEQLCEKFQCAGDKEGQVDQPAPSKHEADEQRTDRRSGRPRDTRDTGCC